MAASWRPCDWSNAEQTWTLEYNGNQAKIRNGDLCLSVAQNGAPGYTRCDGEIFTGDLLWWTLEAVSEKQFTARHVAEGARAHSYFLS